MASFPFYLTLITVLVMLILLANKMKIAYPILLVLAGLIIGFLPGMPTIHLDPEIIFFLFLPPIIFDSTWKTSWKELWKWRRIIGSFAFIVVFLTACCVAYTCTLWLPHFTLALGFVLGGIISPPDSISASAIMKFLIVPKRVMSMLEGESLLNDASSLIIFQFALLTVSTGTFIWHAALLKFAWMIAGGTGVGLLISWLFIKFESKIPTDANIDIIISLLIPYLLYFVGDKIGSSGILAVVSGGLYLSRNRQDFLSGTSRIRTINFIGGLVFVLNGLVFLLIGLAVPEAVNGLEKENQSIWGAIGYGMLIMAVLFLTRMAAAFGASLTTIIARNFIKVADPHPGYKVPLVLGWSGMRGIVSLAVALSVATSVPHRNLILVITFVAIMGSLLIQGLTLPILIRRINLPSFDDYPPADAGKRQLRSELHATSVNFIDDKFSDQPFYSQLLEKINYRKSEDHFGTGQDQQMADCEAYLKVLEHQRRWLHKKNIIDQQVDEDLIRLHVELIDLEEERIRMM